MSRKSERLSSKNDVLERKNVSSNYKSNIQQSRFRKKNPKARETMEVSDTIMDGYLDEQSLENIEDSSTPPKQRKICNAAVNQDGTSPTIPSDILSKLSIKSPSSKLENTEYLSCTRKSLFSTDIFQKAKRSLHSTTPLTLPGRKHEYEQLTSFLHNHLNKKMSGSLYISGPPGTGKTACLTLMLEDKNVTEKFNKVYVNCTSIKSSRAIFSRIIKELGLKGTAKSEKEYLNIIEKYFSKIKGMILLILDEMDQLESKNQSILYTIFEWPTKFPNNIVLVGIANALDLTDRILPRLQARCELKPELLHFAPYSKQQILDIIISRLEEVDALRVFSSSALQMLAGKVAAVSGDVRRALDIARRVIEVVERDKKSDILQSIENIQKENSDEMKKVDMKEVIAILKQVYGTSQNLTNDCDGDYPLQQKIIVCSLLLILQITKNKDVTIGKLHDVYKKVCKKRNLFSVDQAEFVGLCSLIETKGILKVSGKKEPRLHKISLEWDQEEVVDALKDKKLISSILQDTELISRS